MATASRRIVDKWLADKIEDELKALRDDGLNGAGTVFSILANVSQLHENDVKHVEKEFEKTMLRLRKAANLPERWRHVRAALTE